MSNEKSVTTKPAQAQQPASFQSLLKTTAIKNRFAELLRGNPAGFISALLAVYNGNAELQKCSAKSILAAAGFAAAHNLSVSPALGEAYIVPYNGQAQFQLSYRGLIQLAMRTGEYRTINAGAVYEGQIKDVDFVTGEIIRGEKTSNKIVGYIAYIELLNGFFKAIYMTVDEIEEHARKYSRSYRNDRNGSSVWSKNFGTMAKKTVLKSLLGTYGPKSNDPTARSLRIAMQGDQAVIDKDSFTYPDSDGGVVQREDTIDIEIAENPAPAAEEPETEIVDTETGEVVDKQQPLFMFNG